MPNEIQGGCVCGAIRYEISGDPILTYNCHCRACQQFTGSGHVSGIIMPAPAFRILQGEPAYYTTQGDSGGDTNRGFCAVCSAPVCATFTQMPEAVSIPATSLDDPSRHPPTMDIYTSHAQPWDCMNPELPKFAEMPPTE